MIPDGKRLKRCEPDSPDYAELGEYFEINTRDDAVGATHVNLEARARELGVIQDWEELE